MGNYFFLRYKIIVVVFFFHSVGFFFNSAKAEYICCIKKINLSNLLDCHPRVDFQVGVQFLAPYGWRLVFCIIIWQTQS